VTMIPTVTGEVRGDALGVTLMHEHVVITSPTLQEAFPGFMGFDEPSAIASAHERLKALKASGVDTILDLTAPGLGRNVRRLAKIVEGTGLQVIVCTGYYTYADLPFPMKYNGPGKMFADPHDDLLLSLFVRDIEEGIEGTEIRAGILKCCTDAPGVTEDVERILRAVARAQLRTGIPISTHTHAPTRRGLDQQRIFAEEGVDLTRVVIGHCNDSTDLGYFEELIAHGSYLGFDKCGQPFAVSLQAQLDTLAELCRRGYADRMVLSHDTHCISDWFDETDVKTLLPWWNYQYVHSAVLPGLRERGVTENQLDQMLIGNPRTLFDRQHNGRQTTVA